MRISVHLAMIISFATCLWSCEGQTNLIQEELVKLAHENGLPGLNLSVIYPDGMQQDFSVGYADTVSKTVLSPEHVLFSGSIGKTYAAAIIMQLVEEGDLDISKQYLEYFPDNQWLVRLPGISEITVDMLMKHCSGLPEYVAVQAVWDSLVSNPDKVWSYEDRLMHIMDSSSIHPPGQGWYYSDTNYILIGMLIEKLSGEAYYDVLTSRILVPGKLEDTYASLSRDIPGLPVGYSELPDFFRMPGETVINGSYIFNPQMEWTGGGLASTTSDLARWVRYYYQAEFFSSSSLKLITTSSDCGKNIGENVSYGMGSFIYETMHGPAYAHTGFVPGFNSIFAYFPAYDLSIAMQSNCDFAGRNYGLIHYLEQIIDKLDL